MSEDAPSLAKDGFTSAIEVGAHPLTGHELLNFELGHYLGYHFCG